MIEIVEGRGVGSGKSYFVCTRIIQYLAQGGTIYASDTFGLKWKETKELVEIRFGVELEEGQFVEFPRKEMRRLHEITPQGTDDHPVLIILDEAHMELNARDWNDKGRREFFDWLTQSRHDNNDLIFISQSAFNIDNQIRRLVTFIIRARNMANFTFPGLGKWPLKQFVVNKFDQDGKTLLERKWLKHDKGIFGCYNSKVMRGAHKRSGLIIPRRKLNKQKKATNAMMKFIILFALLAVGFGAYKMYTLKDDKYVGQMIPGGEKATGGKTLAQKAQEMTKAGNEAAYQLYDESFKSFDGRDVVLRTGEGEYRLGEMSNKGFVVALTPQIARVMQPDGKIGWVVARVKEQQVGAGAPVPPPAAPSTPAPQQQGAQGGVSRSSEPRKPTTRAMNMYRVQAGLAPTPEENEEILNMQAGLPSNVNGRLDRP